MSFGMDGQFRMAPLRKEICSEGKLDICVFFVPDRHVHGAKYIAMMQEGYDHNETLVGVATVSGERDLGYLTYREAPAEIPKAIPWGYDYIWDRYYRVPSQPRDAAFGVLPAGLSDAAKRHRKYGRYVARLPHILNSANRVNAPGDQPWRDLVDGDADVAAGSVVSVRDIALVQKQLKSEIDRTQMSERFTDIMELTWKVPPLNVDADQRPTLLFRHQQWISGADVDGTDDATLGQFTGKTLVPVRWKMPSKYFSEHGTIFILMCLRFPFLSTRVINPLMLQPSPSASDYIIDPEIASKEPPRGMNWADWLQPTGGSSASAEYQIAHGQHYRVGFERIHQDFEDLPGYPFRSDVDLTGQAYYYHNDQDYQTVFMNSQVGYYQIHSMLQAERRSLLAPPGASLYAGTN